MAFIKLSVYLKNIQSFKFANIHTRWRFKKILNEACVSIDLESLTKNAKRIYGFCEMICIENI